MRIYFAGAISGSRDHAAVYAHIVAHLQARGHIVPSAHVADLSVLERESAFSPRKVYQRDVGWIEQIISKSQEPCGYESGR